jgi:hypothetical protein
MSLSVIIDGVQYVPLVGAPSDPYPLPEGYLSPHFREAEFCCNHCGSLEGHEVPEELLRVLELCRAHFSSAPITINSGYRCSIHNANVGSNEASQHRRATAADIAVKDVAPAKVYDYLITSYPGAYGIGSYPSFTHIDVRPDKARW